MSDEMQVPMPRLPVEQQVFRPQILLGFAALVVLSYAVVLWRLGIVWFTSDDMSHGPFVPFLAGFIIWRERKQLAAIDVRPNLWGLVLMLFGATMLCIGPPSLPTFVFITRIAFVLSLIGLLLAVAGTNVIRALAYPLVLLLLMIPLPGFVLGWITLPLQFVASSLAEVMLDGLGVSVLREGNILHVPNQTLAVAEACSGIRSLLSLLFLGQAYVYLFDERGWMRLAMAVLTIPIAVIANGGRIVTTALLGQFDRNWVHGLMHESTGWIVFAIAFACIVLSHRAISLATRGLGR